jgi:hypothetical protein
MKLFVKPLTESELPIYIEKIEEKYGVKFVGDFCVRAMYNMWTDFPVAVFYQPNPNRELGHSNYFGIHINRYLEGNCSICDAQSAFSQPIIGAVADNGEVIYSKYRHDYAVSEDGTVFIDGGRDSIRAPLNALLVKLIMTDGEFKIEEIDAKEFD